MHHDGCSSFEIPTFWNMELAILVHLSWKIYSTAESAEHKTYMYESTIYFIVFYKMKMFSTKSVFIIRIFF